MRNARVQVMVLLVLAAAVLGSLASTVAGSAPIAVALDNSTSRLVAINLQRPSASARLKVRFNDQDSIRILPDGRLLSLAGHDVSALQDTIDSNDVRLTPVISLSEERVQRIRTAYRTSTGRVMPDIASTMWIDGPADAVDAVAQHLRNKDALSLAAFRSTATRAGASTPSALHELAGIDRGNKDTFDRFDRFDRGPRWPEEPDMYDELDAMVGVVPMPDPGTQWRAHKTNVQDMLDRGQAYARGKNREARRRNNRFGDAIYCCVFTLTGLPGDETWEKRCEGSLGDWTSDMCDALNIDGVSVAFIRNPWTGPSDPTNDCFTNCLDNTIANNNYGACCIPGTRDGDDQLQFDCEKAAGDFQGMTGNPSTYLAYANCEACPPIYGACCFEVEADPAYIWDNTFPVWAKDYCNGQYALIVEPAVAVSRLRSGASGFYTGWTPLIDNQDAGWTWQDEDPPPPRIMNPTIIVNNRLMSSALDETACNLCVDAGGTYAGDGTKPQTVVWETFPGVEAICGIVLGWDNLTIPTTCPDGIAPRRGDGTPWGLKADEPGHTLVIGACADSGTATLATYEDCADAEAPEWQYWMIMPSNSLTPQVEGTDIHQGFWRPFWCQWFTPPATGTAFEVPDKFDFFVPFWEYAGTYTPWTGYDPARWWDEGFQPNLAPVGQPATSRTQFIENIFPEISLESGLMIAWPMDDGEVDPDFIRNYTPADFGPVIRFAVAPTCDEWWDDLGLPQQAGDIFDWDDPETGATWPVYPTVNPFVFEVQCVGSGDLEVDAWPWDFGWTRWTLDPKFFDMQHDARQNNGLGFSPAYDFSGGQRYLSRERAGITDWTYIGDGLDPHPNDGPLPPWDDQYGWPYFPGGSGEVVRGSCYQQHTDFFPTISGTENNHDFPGDQSCYIGTYCDEAACCDAVNEIVTGCCADATTDFPSWNSLCVQVALDLVMVAKASGAYYTPGETPWLCEGLSPYMTPEYPVDLLGSETLKQWQYNPDARNSRLNDYLAMTLPASIVPSLPAVPPSDPAWQDYRLQVNLAARVAMFAPRCQGIYSPKGQCNVPGVESGLSSWDVAADDEDLILGCQDFACCMTTVQQMLILKDSDSANDEFNDLEWMPRQWTGEMAALARSNCYPGVAGTMDMVNDDTPDFFPLQLHMATAALLETAAVSTTPKGSLTTMVRRVTGPNNNVIDTWTSSAIGSTFSIDLTQLITAPFNSTLRASATQPLTNQNVYDVLPGPYYGADGLGLYPAQSNAVFDGDFESLLKISQNFAAFGSTEVGGFGRGTQIAVLAESAWLQTADGGFGAVHEDLGNILPDPMYDWSEVDGTGAYTNPLLLTDLDAAARGTAVLGIIGATSPRANWTDVTTIDTGGACCLVTSCSSNVLMSRSDCHLQGGTFYGGMTCTDIGNCTTRASVPGTNTFGVRGMAPDARTWFMPTKTPTGDRLEDAFYSAMVVLQPGDILLLALNGAPYDDATGCVLLDAEVQTLVTFAQQLDIVVIVPAGDQQVPVAVEIDDGGGGGLAFGGDDDDDLFLSMESLLLVGGAVPATDNAYLRWWTSNYATADTVAAADPSTVNICAWGGLVTTTGGNMNLTRTIQNEATFTDTSLTRRRSYTNDFGSQLNGSIAAAAQIAGATACIQGFTEQIYEQKLSPTFLADRLHSTAVFAGTNVGSGYLGAAGTYAGQYSWDLNEAVATPNWVGRFPQLANMALDITLIDPPVNNDDFARRPPSAIERFDILVGTYISGNLIDLVEADEDLVVSVESVVFNEGPINTDDIWVPGGCYHLGNGHAIEIMVTFQTSGIFDWGGEEVFRLLVDRLGPNGVYGLELAYMFNWVTGEWDQLNAAVLVVPGEPAIPNEFFVWDGIDWRDYLNPNEGDRLNEIYVRLGYTCVDDYEIEFDQIALRGLDYPNPGGN